MTRCSRLLPPRRRHVPPDPSPGYLSSQWPITRREGGAVTSVLVFGAFVGVMVALAGLLTLVCRRWMGGPPPPPRRARRFRRRPRLPLDPIPAADGTRARRVVRVRRMTGPVTQRRPVQEVAADLRRLARELAGV